MTRPVPLPSSLSRPFWEAARRGELVLPRCSACGLRFFTPEPACPHCWSGTWTYERSAGRGTVYSVTAVHRAPGPGFEAPYALAVIELDEGVTMLSHVVGLPADEVTIGMRVAVHFQPLTDDITLPCFSPDRAEASA
ncbi:Zn-ribbon domain-containing OB-fold protein [Kitasatospora sp. NPDC101235]|uniref:Zn-ribbon domain-containing OB-fold protein n=1 Tax=Kitasatospora sp. NPDC101235 TaxID=3364101 RepID=UPI0037FF1F04